MRKRPPMSVRDKLKRLNDQISSILSSSIEITSRGLTAADASSLSTSRKKENDDSRLSVQSKKPKTANTCADSSKCTTSSYPTEAAAATNVQSSMAMVTNPTGIMDPLPGSSHEESSRTVSRIPISSVGNGTWSQESNNVRETPIKLYHQNLNDKNIQEDLQFIHIHSNSLFWPQNIIN